jgi:large subunit ribosomal protein L15
MKLHDLHPAAGSRRARTRVGRGIAAGQGKTAGRGTKGQKARAGASIPAWFEGGQTPIHIRVPKLRGFKNRFKIHYQVVNVGAIAEYAAAGRFGVEGAGKSDVPTINAEALASAGLISSTERPVKVLGHGDVSQKLFVAADAFSASARSKLEAAGGFVQVLAPEKPTAPEQTEDADQGDEADRADDAAKPGKASKPSKTDKSSKSGKADKAPPEPQPDVDASEAPESEGSATQAVAVDASAEADAEESAETAESAPAEESAAADKPSRRRSSKTTSEE